MGHDGDQPYECLFVIWWVLTAFMTALALAHYELLWATASASIALTIGIVADVKTKGRFARGGFPFNAIYRFYA